MKRENLLLPFEKYFFPEKRVSPQLAQIVKEFNHQVISGVYRPSWNKCLCSNKDFDIIAGVDKYGFIAPLSICKSCGMISLNPRFSDTYYTDLRKHKSYFETFFGYADPREYAFSKINLFQGTSIFSLLKHVMNIDKETKVLEIGAGAGWNFLPFIQAGIHIKGYEEDKTFVDIGISLGMDIEQKGIEKLPEQADYDVIILSGVLNRVYLPLATLSRVKNLVKPSGIIYIDVPVLNFKTLNYRVDWLYYFTPDTFRYFVADIGLKPLEIRMIDGHIAGVFRKEDFPNSRYLLTRNKQQSYKYLKRLRYREAWTFSKKLKNKEDVPFSRIFEKND